MDNGRSGQYNVYGARELIRSNIAYLDMECSSAAVRMKTLYHQGNMRYVRAFWVFYECFQNLVLTSKEYVKNDELLKRLHEAFQDPSLLDPLNLFDLYSEYKTVMKKSGLNEIGYKDYSFTQKMRNRT